MKKYLLLFLWFFAFAGHFINAQVDPNGYNTFYYNNGNLSSEGTLSNGQPDGYWKNYYENGVIKSEGNRKDFLLDSLWIFYDTKGNPTTKINYKEGKRNGITITYDDGGYLEENYLNDIRNGITQYFDTLNRKLKEMRYLNGLLDGKAYEYDTTGMIITISEYKNAAMLYQEIINRYDANGLKQGLWKKFHANGRLHIEAFYYAGELNGFYKEYDEQGNLQNILKYSMGEILENVKELEKPEIRTDRYPSGRIKVVGSYRNNVPDGLRTEFSPEGVIEKSYIFERGYLIAEGLIDNEGFRRGEWKDFYPSGKLRGTGVYKDGKRTGEWIWYHENGEIEQKGVYYDGEIPTGKWLWYYDNGNVRKEETFINGLAEGLYVEYYENGKVLTKGHLIEGLKEGKWITDTGNYIEEGDYRLGEKDGPWVGYYEVPENKAFQGSFMDGAPDGRHTFYYENGQIKLVGRYVAGKREGDWVKYHPDGLVLLTITYRNGLEYKYDGVEVKPEFDAEDEHDIMY